MDEDQPTIKAVQRAEAAHAEPLAKRDAIRRELESELRGLLMAARMHGYRVGFMDGLPGLSIIECRCTA